MTPRRTALVIATVLLVPLVATSPAQAAPLCPTVDPATHQVSPAPSIGADWSGCDLSGADLAFASISGVSLAGADLRGADLSVATVSRTDLSGADLTGAALTVVSIHGSSVTGAVLAGADLSYARGSNLTGAPASMPTGWSVTKGYVAGPTAMLDGADLSGSDLAGRDLADASLVGARLDGSDLDGTALDRAILEGASVTRASLQGTVLDDAMLDGVHSGRVTGATARLPVGWSLTSGHLVGPGADLAYADLDGVSLVGRDLRGADLYGASMTGAVLAAADLGGVRLDMADLDGGDLSYTRLGWTTLHGTSLVGTKLRFAQFDSSTYLDTSAVAGADFTGATGLLAANAANVWWDTAICPDGKVARRHDDGSCLKPLDTTAPVQRLAALPAFVAPHTSLLLPTIALASSATDGGSGLASVTLRWRSRAPGATGWSGFSTAPLQGGPSQAWAQPTKVGYRYCFSIRSADVAGNVTPWSGERCTTVVGDDKALVGARAWKRLDPTSSGYYRRTRSSTTTTGAELSTSFASTVRSVAVLGTRCPSCGAVAVYVGSVRVGTVSFRSASTAYRALTTITVPAARYGKVRLVVTSSGGRPVHIDGLGTA